MDGYFNIISVLDEGVLIGNKIPFEKRLNIIASNGYFDKKKMSYAESKIEITKAFAKIDAHEWNLDSITERDIRVSDSIKKILDQWKDDYTATSVVEQRKIPSKEEIAMIEKFKKNGWV